MKHPNNEALPLHLKAAEKENRILLARLVKLSAAASAVLPIPVHEPADESKLGDYNRLLNARTKLRTVLEEMPPK